jgi:hypothetical protein
MYSNSTVNTGALTGAFLASSIFGLIFLILFIVIYWRIFSKAGYNGALSLLLLIPIVNIIMLFVLAFGNWPIHRELNALRQQLAQGQRNPASPPPFPQSAPSGYPQQYPSSPQYPSYNQPPQYNQPQSGQQPQPPQNR